MPLRLEPADEYLHELGPGADLQRVHVLQRVRPGRAGRRVRPPRQPGQRGLRRDDHVPLPARRAGGVHVPPARDQRQRRLRRRRHALRGGRAVRGAAVSYEGKVVMLDDPLAMADPERRSPRTRTAVPGRADLHAGQRHGRRRARRERHEREGEEFAKGHYEQLVGGHGHDRRRRRGVGRRGLRPPGPLVGARGTGRRPGTTGGSPPTSAATSASWAHASPGPTARACGAGSSGTASGSSRATGFEISTDWTETATLPPGASRPCSTTTTARWQINGQGAEPDPARATGARAWSPASPRA